MFALALLRTDIVENKSCSSYDFKKNNVDWYLTNSKFEDGSCAKFCPLSVEMFAVTFLRTNRNGVEEGQSVRKKIVRNPQKLSREIQIPLSVEMSALTFLRTDRNGEM